MRTPAVALCLALTVALAGCGGGTSKVAAPSTTAAPVTVTAAADKAAVAKAVKAYSAALVAGAGKKAYPMLSAHCRTVIKASAFSAMAAQAHTTYPKAKIIKLTVDDVTGTQAHVTYSYREAVLNQSGQSWVKEHGAWRSNAC